MKIEVGSQKSKVGGPATAVAGRRAEAERTQGAPAGTGRCIAGVALLLLFAVSSWASISVTPRSSLITLGQGARKDLQFLVINDDSRETMTVRCLPAGFREDVDGTFQILTDTASDSAFSCRRWFPPDTQKIVLAPGEGKYVTVKLVVPPGVHGTHYGAICFDQMPKPQTQLNYADVSVFVRIPAFVEIAIPGARYKGKPDLDSVRIVPTGEVKRYLPIGTSPTGLAFTALVTNDGEVTVPIRGRIVIRDDQGRRVRELPLSSGGRLLPGARVRLISLTRDLRPGDYTAEVTLAYGGLIPVKAAVPVQVSSVGTPSAGRMELAPTLSVTVNAELVDIAANPKSYRTQYVILRNEGDQPVSFNAGVKFLKNDVYGNLMEADSGDPARSCRDWLKVAPQQFEIPPGSTTPVKLALHVPDSATGGYYACLYLEAGDSAGTAKPEAPDPRSPKVRASISIPVLVALRDSSGAKAEVTGVTYTTDPAGVTVNVINDGDVHLKPKGRAVFRPMTGSGDANAAPEVVELGSDQVVLPHSAIRISGTSGVRLPRGSYDLEVALDCGKLQLKRSERVEVN